MRKSPELQQITKSFSWSLPLHGKAKPHFFIRIIAHCTFLASQVCAMADGVSGLQIAVPVSAMLLEGRCKA